MRKKKEKVKEKEKEKEKEKRKRKRKSKKKKRKPESMLVAQRLQRKLALQEGFYDGRFKEKTIKDKKKEANRNWARRKGTKED